MSDDHALGVLVEPLEYWMSATSEPDASSKSPTGGVRRSWSVASQVTVGVAYPCNARLATRMRLKAVVVSAWEAPAWAAWRLNCA
jgi:hypothetical protein